ncbi:hypothetical protein K1T71_007155 [Dendrolimus kikuchii]|uniref:Uncharacterized protein n=1 Tax=Dendrolimus kikuchii TaxID=765133 RepID=A0ACC1CZX3_9NEOP|nr:hypothetical protein K1T71_007155 [Dendrolimus kikuchii]
MPTKSQSAIFMQTHKYITFLLEIANLILKGDKKYSVNDFIGRFTKLDDIKGKLDTVYYEILDSKDLDDKVEKWYFDYYTSAIEAYEKILVANITISSSIKPSSPTFSTSTVLPKIDLPKFSSKLEDWPSFITIFKSLTDTAGNLSGAVKLHYLFSCLSGEALSMVSHLKVTDENYDVAMTTLANRYENRRVLIDRFIDMILELPHITTRSQIRQLFLAPLISTQSALKNLNLPLHDSDYVLQNTWQLLFLSSSHKTPENNVGLQNRNSKV